MATVYPEGTYRETSSATWAILPKQEGASKAMDENIVAEVSRKKQAWLKQSDLRKVENLSNLKKQPYHNVLVRVEALPCGLKRQGFLGRTGEVTDSSSDEWFVSIKSRKGRIIPLRVYVGNLTIVRMIPRRQQKQQLRQRQKQVRQRTKAATSSQSNKTAISIGYRKRWHSERSTRQRQCTRSKGKKSRSSWGEKSYRGVPHLKKKNRLQNTRSKSKKKQNQAAKTIRSSKQPMCNNQSSSTSSWIKPITDRIKPIMDCFGRLKQRIMDYNRIFPIHVRTLTGNEIHLNVESTYTVGQVKTMIGSKLMVPTGGLRLIFNKKQLKENDRTLHHCEIQKDSYLYLVFALRGGGKKGVASNGNNEPVRFDSLEFKPPKSGNRFSSDQVHLLLKLGYQPEEIVAEFKNKGYKPSSKTTVIDRRKEIENSMVLTDKDKEVYEDWTADSTCPMMIRSGPSLTKGNKIYKLKYPVDGRGKFTDAQIVTLRNFFPRKEVKEGLKGFNREANIDKASKGLQASSSDEMQDELKLLVATVEEISTTSSTEDNVVGDTRSKDVAAEKVESTTPAGLHLKSPSPTSSCDVVTPSTSASDSHSSFSFDEEANSHSESTATRDCAGSNHSTSGDNELDERLLQEQKVVGIAKQQRNDSLFVSEGSNVEAPTSITPTSMEASSGKFTATQRDSSSLSNFTTDQLFAELERRGDDANKNFRLGAFVQKYIDNRITDKGEVVIESKIPGKQKTSQKYLRVNSRKRALKDDATPESRRDYLRRIANRVSDFVKESLSGDNEGKYAKEVTRILAEDCDFVVLEPPPVGNSYLDVADTIAVRDEIGASTNMIQALQSSLQALLPNHFRRIFPSLLKAKIAAYEGCRKEDVAVKQVELIVNKENSIQNICTFSYLKHPWKLIEDIVANAVSKDEYESSAEWGALVDKCFITACIDKGGDHIMNSIRCANKKQGNSMNETYAIGVIEGPVNECYENERKTIFSDWCPLNKFLHNLTDKAYFVLVVKNNNGESKAVVFLPTQTEKRKDRSITVELGELIDDDDLNSDNDSQQSEEAPKINIPEGDTVTVNLIKSQSNQGYISGVQFVTESCTHSVEFNAPMKLEEIDDAEVWAHQIIGIPVNDMKQQTILSGIPSCSSTCACPSCISTREDFGKRNKSLYEREEGVSGSSYKERELRRGKWSTARCCETYNKKTFGGAKLTAEQNKRLTLETASVTRPPLWDYDPELNSGEPMHISSGICTHFLDEIRDWIRNFEKEASFMTDLRTLGGDDGGDGEIKSLLDSVATTVSSMSDSGASNENIALHKESLALRRKYVNLSREIDERKSAKDKELLDLYEQADDVSECDEQYLEEIWEVEKAYDEQIAALQLKLERAEKECTDYGDESLYNHNNAVSAGYARFQVQLKRFMNKSKRPHGKLEFVFDKAIEHREIGKGKFMAEHSGFEQTNGNNMNTLENFNKIAEACTSVYEEHTDEYKEVKEQFEKFSKVAAKLFIVCKQLKSQEKRDPDKFDQCVLEFLKIYEEVIGPKYFNKLHFLHAHTTMFVRLFECVGRFSGESHEASHARFSRTQKYLNKMSPVQMAKTFFSRTGATLDSAVNQSSQKIKDKRTGKKRPGGYNKATRKDSCCYDEEELNQVVVEGTKYFLIDGGRIEEKDIELYQYVVHGRAPSEWTKCFEGIVSTVYKPPTHARH